MPRKMPKPLDPRKLREAAKDAFGPPKAGRNKPRPRIRLKPPPRVRRRRTR